MDNSDLVIDPLSDAAVNVREWRRQYDRQTRLPRPLVEETARVTSLAQAEWAAARRDADFARFRPWLERVTALKQREAEAVGYRTEPYDALLDEYEPGTTAHDLERVFSVLSEELSELAGRLAAAPRRPNAAVLRRDYPVERQRAFGAAAAATLGFDFRRGRLDDTTHPFFAPSAPATAASRRATTRTTSATPFSARCTRSATACTSRRWTRRLTACRSARRRRWAPTNRRPGCGKTPSAAAGPSGSISIPLARQAFPEALGDVGLTEFHFAVNGVEPSLIRVRADEVTYDLHILARFRLERALISGDLRPADLPAAWDEAHRPLLGVSPRDDAEGCLQDGHWAAGLFGYFPTYTLGNVIAAQLLRAGRGGTRRRGPRICARRFLRPAGLAARPILLPRRPLHGGAAGGTGDRLAAGPGAAGGVAAAEV